MSDLPACRLELAKSFTHTSVDYVTPLYVTLGRKRGVRSHKAYIYYLVVRAVHLKLKSDLSLGLFSRSAKRIDKDAEASLEAILTTKTYRSTSSHALPVLADVEPVDLDVERRCRIEEELIVKTPGEIKVFGKGVTGEMYRVWQKR
ncbi:hypothetical protein EVAR_62435_1 [Eumeta japonica]|uniref:Uncharacterized protein n=1 Tax=Eumeta variegata TaxID=151549 RepID=A0A4C1Z3R8_EUMVA|nr:hypothetical protein EVAR_62435_1 [Eumeta japonica]